jgi:hypothetical protein
VGLDRAIRTFYSSLSGAAAYRRWHQFRALFDEVAKIQLCGPPDPVLAPGAFSAEEFIRAARERARSLELVETDRTVRIDGDLAVVESSYRATSATGLVATRGINEIHLRRVARRWAIILVVCEERESSVSLATSRRSLGPSLRAPPQRPRPREGAPTWRVPWKAAPARCRAI